VLFAGGGNLTDQFPKLMARRAALAAVAEAFDLRYIVSGQGIGPITGALRDLLALLVAGATHFGVRDPLSLEDLRHLPVPCDHAVLVGDDALGLARSAPGVIDSLLAKVGVPLHQPLLGFHAREANYVGLTREDLQATATRVDELAAQNGQAVVCLPINTQPWAPERVLMASLVAGLKRRQARWFLADAEERVDIVAALVARCAAVVSHSYHVALFALATGVPVLVQAGTEYYRRKAEGLRQFFQVRAEIGLPSHADTHWMSQQLRRMNEEAWSPLRMPAEMDEWMRQALPPQVSTRDQTARLYAQSAPSGQRAAA
jgi:polysaccharide pyruvyl transferase WcaK-like protein